MVEVGKDYTFTGRDGPARLSSGAALLGSPLPGFARLT
jgi:hypothetical protein